MQHLLQEDLAFEGDSIYLTSYLGPLSFEISGSYSARQADGPAMDFQFTSMDVRAVGRSVTQRKLTGKSKTYNFVGQGRGLLVVRSSQGGMSLWVARHLKPTQRPNIDFLATEL